MKNTRKNPSNTFALSELRGKWLTEKYRIEDETRMLKEMSRLAIDFHGKDLTQLKLKRGKKVFIKTSEGLKQLTLSNV